MNIKRRLPDFKKHNNFRLNLGCGNDKEKGFIGIDIKDCGQEIIWDIREGIPFSDNSVDLIWTSHFLEHLDNQESEDLLREIYRVLKQGGITQNVVPYALDPTAYYFDHKTFWNEARISTLTGVPGLEGFEIIKNLMTDKLNSLARLELLFTLKKI